MRTRVLLGRKLLVASLGVATVSYVACSGQVDATDAGADAAPDRLVTSGNLVAPPPDASPPPPDAATDASDASDASDSGRD